MKTTFYCSMLAAIPVTGLELGYMSQAAYDYGNREAPPALFPEDYDKTIMDKLRLANESWSS